MAERQFASARLEDARLYVAQLRRRVDSDDPPTIAEMHFHLNRIHAAVTPLPSQNQEYYQRRLRYEQAARAEGMDLDEEREEDLAAGRTYADVDVG